MASWLKTSSKVDSDVRNRFSSVLWGLQLKMTLGMDYLVVHVTDKNFVKLSHPPPLRRDICDIDCTGLKTI